MSIKQAKLIVNAHKHNVHRNRKAYWGRGEWGGMGGRVGGCGRGRLYTYRYTVPTRMTPALRWEAMRAILRTMSGLEKKLVLSRAHLCPEVCLKWRVCMPRGGWGGGGGGRGGHLF